MPMLVLMTGMDLDLGGGNNADECVDNEEGLWRKGTFAGIVDVDGDTWIGLTMYCISPIIMVHYT